MHSKQGRAYTSDVHDQVRLYIQIKPTNFKCYLREYLFLELTSSTKATSTSWQWQHSDYNATCLKRTPLEILPSQKRPLYRPQQIVTVTEIHGNRTFLEIPLFWQQWWTFQTGFIPYIKSLVYILVFFVELEGKHTVGSDHKTKCEFLAKRRLWWRYWLWCGSCGILWGCRFCCYNTKIMW